MILLTCIIFYIIINLEIASTYAMLIVTKQCPIAVGDIKNILHFIGLLLIFGLLAAIYAVISETWYKYNN